MRGGSAVHPRFQEKYRRIDWLGDGMPCVSRYEYRFRGTRVYIGIFPIEYSSSLLGQYHQPYFPIMRSIIILSVAVAFITRVCLAVPYPATPLHAPKPPIRPVDGFWDCIKCQAECAAVVAGCGAVCALVEWTGPLCTVRKTAMPCLQSLPRLRQSSELSEYVP